MNKPLKKKRPETGSLTAEAHARIRADILRCHLEPGRKLVIQEICDQFGFSLGAVREALSRLTAEGLVEAQPRKGFAVTPVTEAELKDITQVRIEIETACLRRAIKNGDLRWESALVALLFELSRLPISASGKKPGLSEAWSETHRRFHQTLVAPCGSPWLLRLRETLYVQSERYRWMSLPLDTRKRDLQAEHEAIAKAAMARDAKLACHLMAEHIARTAQIILDSGVARGKN